jgi:hypothetical protein
MTKMTRDENVDGGAQHDDGEHRRSGRRENRPQA